MENTGRIREMIARVVPGFEQLEKIEETKAEFHIPGRTIHEPKFPTPSGLAKLHRHSLPPLSEGWLPDHDGQTLRLMTARSEGQFNTVVYEDYDLYRAQDRRDVILMHPDDIASRGLEAEQRVTVTSEVGSMKNILVRSFPQIRAGNALMYYPEANVLVPRRADPQSKTPAFKCVPVTVSSTASANASVDRARDRASLAP